MAAAVIGTTGSGFQFRLEKEALDDWELIEDLTLVQDADNPNPGAVIRCLKRLLGNDQYILLKDHLRKEGRVSAASMIHEMEEIFELSGDDTKKS